MSEVALTDISVGRYVDEVFERVEISAGSELPSWVSKDDKEALRANGALGTKPTLTAVADKDAEIADLKQKIAELQAAAEAKDSTAKAPAK